MRKLLFISIVPIVAAAGCQGGSMRRMEVWKQQTFFGPSETMVSTGPMTGYGAMPADYTVMPGPVMPGVGAADSAEEVNGVLEQP